MGPPPFRAEIVCLASSKTHAGRHLPLRVYSSNVNAVIVDFTLIFEINYNCVYIINFRKKILCTGMRLPPLKCTYLREFFMDFQNFGTWMKLR